MPKVRMRGDKVSLPVSVDVEGKGLLRAVLKPGVWTEVEPEIYNALKTKFGDGDIQTVSAPDPDTNEKHPHGVGDAPVMRQEQAFDHTYILDFKR